MILITDINVEETVVFDFESTSFILCFNNVNF